MKFSCNELLDNSTNEVRTGGKQTEDKAAAPPRLLEQQKTWVGNVTGTAGKTMVTPSSSRGIHGSAELESCNVGC